MVHRVLSVDLAVKSYMDVGICVLEGTRRRSNANPLCASELKLTGKADASELASAILNYCSQHNIRVVLLDGPQAWKDPASQLPYSRRCERELSTPAKTGTVGNVKPRPALPYVQFSIDVFCHLIRSKAKLVLGSPIRVPRFLLAVETFPTSAWRWLGQKPLPGKAKAKDSDIERCVCELRDKFHVEISGKPTHDQVQAAVAGLAGLSILDADASGYCLSGSPPVRRDGILCEGFIVNPQLTKFDRP